MSIDVLRLEFALNKLRVYILKHIEQGKNKFKDGLTIQVILYRKERGSMMNRNTTDMGFTAPICLRVPGHMKVYELREHLANYLPFKDDGPPVREASNLKSDIDVVNPAGEDDEIFADVVPIEPENGGGLTNGNHQEDPGLLLMRQLPMGYAELRNATY
jgi:hypothetical protein